MANRKQEILEKALALFSENGYEAVTVEDIGNACGIKAPSLYSHFKGKRAIFEGIVHRMEEIDTEKMNEFGLPSVSYDEAPEQYQTIPVSMVISYHKAMFRYWTEDTFSAQFRKMITLEQYHDPEMNQLYQQYLSAGPLGLMTDIFRGFGRPDETAFHLALEFYGAVFLLFSAYDGAEDKTSVTRSMDDFIETFLMTRI